MPSTHKIIKGIEIWRVCQQDDRNYLVTNVFWQLVQGSPDCVALRRVLFPSFSSRTLNPGQHYFLQIYDVRHRVDPEVMWEVKWRNNVTIACESTKLNYVNWLFGFYYYECASVTLTLWNLRNGTYVVNAKQCSMPFSDFCGMNCVILFFLRKQNIKKVKRIRKINSFKWWQFTHCSLYRATLINILKIYELYQYILYLTAY